jgi:hypothetical protein
MNLLVKMANLLCILILKVSKGFCPFLLRKENFVLLSANLLRVSSWITSFRQKIAALKG